MVFRLASRFGFVLSILTFISPFLPRPFHETDALIPRTHAQRERKLMK